MERIYSYSSYRCFLYSKESRRGNSIPKQFEGQDSFGAEWVSLNDLSIHNASPLVLKAIEWIQTGSIGLEVTWFEKWEVKKSLQIEGKKESTDDY